VTILVHGEPVTGDTPGVRHGRVRRVGEDGYDSIELIGRGCAADRAVLSGSTRCPAPVLERGGLGGVEDQVDLGDPAVGDGDADDRAAPAGRRVGHEAGSAVDQGRLPSSQERGFR
jgi:hypothetical protein